MTVCLNLVHVIDISSSNMISKSSPRSPCHVARYLKVPNLVFSFLVFFSNPPFHANTTNSPFSARMASSGSSVRFCRPLSQHQMRPLSGPSHISLRLRPSRIGTIKERRKCVAILSYLQSQSPPEYWFMHNSNSVSTSLLCLARLRQWIRNNEYV